MSTSYDVIILGAGPAGYVAAIRCAQLGMKTACVDDWTDEKGKPALGGTCLNVGCIPSKALLESSELYAQSQSQLAEHGIDAGQVKLDLAAMMARKNKIVKELTGGVASLLKSNGVEWIQGRGYLLPDRKVEVTRSDDSKHTLQGKNVILATGSRPMDLPHMAQDHDMIVNSTGALDFDSVPQRLGVIGAGVIGLELGSVWKRLGSEVVIIEAQERFLSMADEQLGSASLKVFR